ncbi:hypothetical protein GE21DRAFT_1044521 [Neurospora crassa]|nr:hypothetical protein GE21DRAFT_1044521 [Neurospora crassa]
MVTQQHTRRTSRNRARASPRDEGIVGRSHRRSGSRATGAFWCCRFGWLKARVRYDLGMRVHKYLYMYLGVTALPWLKRRRSPPRDGV